MTEIGLLTGTNLPRAAAALGHPVEHAGDLGELAERFHHRQVFVHPSAHAGLGLPETLDSRDPGLRARRGIAHPFVGGALGSGWRCAPPGLSHFLVLTRGGRRIDVGLLGYDEAAGLAGEEPATALEALRLYATLLTDYRWSPGATGLALMRQNRRLELGPSTLDPPEPMREGGTEADYLWMRPLTLVERTARWVHAFDRRAQYLAACSAVDLGLGNPERVGPLKAEEALGRHLPGYWRASIRRETGLLPDPFDPIGRGGEWYARPTMALAFDLGRIEDLYEAYVWPRHSRYLVPWYKTLGHAQAALALSQESAAGPTMRLVKRTYTMAIGSLAGHYREAGEELYRPDWRHAIIATARANLTRRLLRLDPPPFAVVVDCLYIASDLPPLEAAAGLPTDGGPGTFRHAGTIPLADALPAIDTGDVRELGRVLREAPAWS